MIDNGTALERWSRGEDITAAKLNAPVDELNRQRGAGPPQEHIEERRGGSSSSIACTIVSIHANHIVCTKKTGGTINVARPLAARSPATETIFGQQWNYTYTDIVQATTPPSGYTARTAVSFPTSTQQEEQIVLRQYVVGGEIRAGRVLGGTGVPEADTYEEIHTDRTWYRKTAAA